MMCISRISKKFGVELSIEDFFMNGASISNLAKEIDLSRLQTEVPPTVV